LEVGVDRTPFFLLLVLLLVCGWYVAGVLLTKMITLFAVSCSCRQNHSFVLLDLVVGVRPCQQHHHAVLLV
jgi:hypothetical protein